jgi:hypothetical protein
MIYLSTTQSSKVVLTLREKSTLLIPYYTFNIENKDSLEQYIFAPENNSLSPYFDSFTISVGTPSVATGSNVVVYCEQGTYNYTVYQTGIEYNLSLTGSIVEVGILTILGTSSNILQFTQSDDDVVRVFNYL